MTTESINLQSWPNDKDSTREPRANVRSRKIRSSLVTAAVVVAHGIGLYFAIHHTSVILTSEGKPAGTVQVTLVAAPTPQPVKPPEQKPQPKPVVKPVVVKPKKASVLSSTAPSPRTVDAAPRNMPKVEKNAPPVQQQAEPATPAAPVAPTVTAPGPNLLDKPKEINEGELKQLGCQIPAPEYPSKAKRLQQEGTVVIKLTIGTDGQVTAARVARSSGFDSLDAAALASIRAGRCRPYTTAGVAQAVQATQPVAFNLND
ncbi:TonB family protein [Paraburkholderia caribensis]|uniref:Protein TonB n=1 Tax=Paraburkholderia caribensis TaxID=75105 RepID=A0A9Q6SA84_9BURK|nr:energy transducer TonB [Paraburkholderia caribensis]MCO4876386.1 TonB family protein [Paraburkholderia caribensis]PTB26976.1 energy transducer TonB [Paraburkholderia caribensis]QLB67554.1 energy transducer TonB [Paraburkholderia caribensis]